jgi:hypothetical protein
METRQTKNRKEEDKYKITKRKLEIEIPPMGFFLPDQITITTIRSRYPNSATILELPCTSVCFNDMAFLQSVNSPTFSKFSKNGLVVIIITFYQHCLQL